jgi:hypothetical protein
VQVIFGIDLSNPVSRICEDGPHKWQSLASN